MRRCIAWILAILLLPAMIVPAYATENEGYANYVDLMAQGYVTVDGVDDTDFRFTGAASNIVEFPVDVIGGMGQVDFVIYSPDSNISITSQNGISFTKYAMGDDLYYFYADVQKSSIERFTFNCPGGKQVYIVSARARMTGDLITDLSFDVVFRIGSYREEFTDRTDYEFRDFAVDYFPDPSVYTQFVSVSVKFNSDTLHGLDYLDTTLFSTGLSSTSITCVTDNNVYLPVSMSFLQSADPAVERDRYGVHIDLSSLPANEDVTLYFYGVTTSSSGTLIFQVPRVVGGITQPEVSGEVGLLGKIWLYLREKLPALDTTLKRIEDLLELSLTGDGSVGSDIQDDQDEARQEATEQLEIIDSVTKPPPEELDELADISGYVDPSGVGVLATTLSPLFESNVFKPIIMLSLTFMLISYVLFGKR